MSNRRTSIIARCLSLMMALIVAMGIVPVGRAFAYSLIDTGADGSLTVVYRDGSIPVTGAQIDLYRVADVSDTVRFSWVDPYDGYGVSLDIEDTAGWHAAAQALAGYVERDQLAPTASQETDASGEARFDALKPGLFLVLSDTYEQNGVRYTPEPALVMVPQLLANDSWAYDATANLKFEKEDIPTQPTTMQVEVIKMWLDDEPETRPASVTVQLLRDGVVFDTQVLSDANGWSYVWTGLDASYTWTVVEAEVPEGYSGSVCREGDLFIVENHADPTEPEIPVTPDDPDTPDTPDTPDKPWTPDEQIPQTGLSHWYILPIALVGIALVVAGWYLAGRASGDDRS